MRRDHRTYIVNLRLLNVGEFLHYAALGFLRERKEVGMVNITFAAVSGALRNIGFHFGDGFDYGVFSAALCGAFSAAL